MNRALWLILASVATAVAASAHAQDRPRAAIEPGAVPAAPQPALTAEEVGRIAAAAQPPKGASLQERARLDRIADLFRQGRQREATTQWARIARPASGRGPSEGEIEAWSWYVMHRAFLQPDPALRAQAAGIAAAPDAQAAALELQAALQKRQQVYHTMSNVLRTLHDTARNSISNIR